MPAARLKAPRKLEPRLPIGMPYFPAPAFEPQTQELAAPQQPVGPSDQMIPEPARIVGDSGQTYATIAENQPEQVTITPPGGSAGAASAASAGEPANAGQVAYFSHDRNGPRGSGQLSGGSVGDEKVVTDDYGYQFLYRKVNGDEWHMVQPLGRSEQEPRSYARGGVLTVAPQPVRTVYNYTDPRTRQARLMAARKNVPGLEAAGMANTIQATENQKYGALGVATPAKINLPVGYQGGLSPLVQPNIRSEEELLREQFADEDAMRLSSGGGLGSTGSSAGEPDYAALRAAGTQMGDEARAQYADDRASRQVGKKIAPPGKVEYTDPFTGNTEYLLPSEAAIRKARDAERIDAEYARRYPDPNKAPEGQEFYDDPRTPEVEHELLTRYEAAIRKQRDAELMDEDYEARYPKATKAVTRKSELEKISVGNLIASIAAKDGVIDEARARAELKARGYSDEEIEILIRIEQMSNEGTDIDTPDFG